MTKIMYGIIIIICIGSSLSYAHDIGMHVYIGSQTFGLWQNYDSAFYNALMLPDTSITGFEVRKFYDIGLTLPDLLRNDNVLFQHILDKLAKIDFTLLGLCSD